MSIGFTPGVTAPATTTPSTPTPAAGPPAARVAAAAHELKLDLTIAGLANPTSAQQSQLDAYLNSFPEDSPERAIVVQQFSDQREVRALLDASPLADRAWVGERGMVARSFVDRLHLEPGTQIPTDAAGFDAFCRERLSPGEYEALRHDIDRAAEWGTATRESSFDSRDDVIKGVMGELKDRQAQLNGERLPGQQSDVRGSVIENSPEKVVYQRGDYTISMQVGDDGQAHGVIYNAKSGEVTTIPKEGETLGFNGTRGFELLDDVHTKIVITSIDGKLAQLSIADDDKTSVNITAVDGALTTEQGSRLNPLSFPLPLFKAREVDGEQSTFGEAWGVQGADAEAWGATGTPTPAATQPPAEPEPPTPAAEPDPPIPPTAPDPAERGHSFADRMNEWLKDPEFAASPLGRFLDPDGDGKVGTPAKGD